MFAPEPIACRRIVAAPAALDAVAWPSGSTPLRIAPDDVLLIGAGTVAVGDPDALVVEDAGWVAVVLDAAAVDEVLARHCQWSPPTGRPALAQGAIAGIPCRIRFGAEGGALVVIPAPFAADLAERLA